MHRQLTDENKALSVAYKAKAHKMEPGATACTRNRGRRIERCPVTICLHTIDLKEPGTSSVRIDWSSWSRVDWDSESTLHYKASNDIWYRAIVARQKLILPIIDDWVSNHTVPHETWAVDRQVVWNKIISCCEETKVLQRIEYRQLLDTLVKYYELTSTENESDSGTSGRA